MNSDTTYSVGSNAWLATGQPVFSFVFGLESSLTRSPMSTEQLFILGSSSLLKDTMLASENALAKDWDSPEEDAAWANL